MAVVNENLEKLCANSSDECTIVGEVDEATANKLINSMMVGAENFKDDFINARQFVDKLLGIDRSAETARIVAERFS